MSNPKLVELHDFSKQFGDFHAIHNINLSINPGEKIALLGPNGAGKSTLLKLIAGVLPRNTGNFYMNSVEYREHSQPLRQQIAYLPDTPPLYDLLNAIEYLEYVAALWNLSLTASIQKLNRLMDDYQLSQHSNIWISNYSKGMKQKLGLISVLFRNSELLLLDEPFNALDTEAVESTVHYLRNPEFVQSAIIVSHDLDIVEKIADKAVIMYRGRIIEQFLTCERLKERYEDVIRREQLTNVSNES